MDKKEILDILDSAKDEKGDVPMRIVKRAFDKLFEPCEGTVSRQVAIDAVHKNYDTILDFESDGRTVADSFEDIINSLPPAQRNGTWITDANDNDNAYCSECGLLTTKDLLKRIALVGENKPKFCPNCGAKMENKEW